MVHRATAVIGVGDALEDTALRTVAALDALTADGEPILSAYRTADDTPWQVDVLFVDTDEEGRERWLEHARALVPTLPAFEIDPLADRDWVAESQRALHPVGAGRFTVHGAHDSARLPPSRWRLLIEAGRAFGTAHHASTQGCLIALERRAMRAPLGTVADVGTGSGVLALAAERLGARRIVAGDIDPEAIAVARANVRANRTLRPIACHVASGPVGPADVVVANILARPLLAMATPLAASAGDTLILSGLRVAHQRPILAAYRARGLVKRSAVVIEGWATLTLERPGRPARRPGASLRAPRWSRAVSPGW